MRLVDAQSGDVVLDTGAMQAQSAPAAAPTSSFGFRLVPVDGGPEINLAPQPAAPSSGAPLTGVPVYGPGDVLMQPEAPVPQPETRGIIGRAVEGAKHGFGASNIGISAENRAKYPVASTVLQPFAAPADLVLRGLSAIIEGGTGALAGLAEAAGLSKANADRLERDLNVIAKVAATQMPTPRPGVAAPAPAVVGAAERATPVAERAPIRAAAEPRMMTPAELETAQLGAGPQPARGAPLRTAPEPPLTVTPAGISAAPAAHAAVPRVPSVEKPAAPVAARGEPRETVIERLRGQTEAAYKEVDESGVRIANQRVKALNDEVKAGLEKTGYDVDLHGPTNVVLARLEKLAEGGDLKFGDLVKVRRVANAAEKQVTKGDTTQLNVLHDIKSSIDDMVTGLTSKQVIAGDVNAAKQLLRANDLYSRTAKLERISDMFDRALNSGQPLERALIGEFRKVANNPKEMRTFRPDERELITKVVRGRGTGEAAARKAGRVAPSTGTTATMGHVALTALGSALGGPIGAALGPVTAVGSEVSRRVAARLLNRRISELETMIANKGSGLASDAVSRARQLLETLRVQATQTGEDKRR
jgi:hypothetical protein